MAEGTLSVNDVQQKAGAEESDKLLMVNATTGAVQVLTVGQVQDKVSSVVVGAGMPGKLDPGATLGTPDTDKIYYVGPGAYNAPSGPIVIDQNLGMLFWDGTSWSSLEIPVDVDTSALATKDVVEENFVALAVDEKQKNLVAIGNDDLSFWTNNTGVTTAFVNPPGSILFKFQKLAIRMTAPASTPAFFGYKIPAVSTDRLVMGAWFYIPDLNVAGNEGFGFYGQVLATTTVAKQVQFLKSEITPGNVGLTKTAAEFSSRIEAISGDWVYISMWNTADMAPTTTAFTINPYMKGQAVSTQYTFHVMNVTLLKGTSEISPYLSYDNSAFPSYIDEWLDANSSSKFDPIESTELNYLKEGDSDLAFWSKAAGVTLSFELPGAKRRFLYKSPIKLTVPAGVSGYIGKKVAVAPTDRIACGAWFYIPTLDQPNITQFGFFGQMETSGSTTNRSIYFSKAELVKGTTKTSSEFASRVEAVNGNWAFISYWNTADMIAGTINFVCNAWVVGGSTVSPYTAYWANLTLVKGVSEVKPYGVYDNSAFTLELINQKAATKNDLLPLMTVENKLRNYLYEGSADLAFWTLPTVNHTKSFVYPPGVLPAVFPKQALKITAPAGQNNFVARSTPVSVTDRVVAGAWFNKSILDVAGVTNLGFYMQCVLADNSVLHRQVQFTKAQLVAGTTRSNTETTATVEVVSGDWVYMSVRNTADFPANTVQYTTNLFSGTSAAGVATDLFIENFSLLKGASTINPYGLYDNSGFVYEVVSEKMASASVLSWLLGKVVEVFGDSIGAQGRVTNSIVTRTGCTISMRAVSGSGYCTAAGSPAKTMLQIITEAGAMAGECILIVSAGTNDYGTNKPLGSSAVLNDDTQFYSAVYNSFRLLKQNNPTKPILVCTPIQRGQTRGTVNSLGLSLKQYAEVIKEVAAIFAIQVLDMQSMSGITYENRTAYLQDESGLYLHPNDQGGAIMAARIVPVLNSLKP